MSFVTLNPTEMAINGQIKGNSGYVPPRDFKDWMNMNMLIAITRCLLPGSGAKAMRWETAPPHQPLIVSYFISIWQLYLIMMAVELTEYWRNYMRSSTNASSTSSTAKSCWGTPSSSRSMLIVLTRYFEWSVVSFHNLQCNVISKKSYFLPKISVWSAVCRPPPLPPLGSYLEFLWRNIGSRL